MSLLGIDISNNNGTVDWSQRKNVAFSITKASEGTYFIDWTARANLIGASAQGLLRGTYHFVDFNDPIQEARYYAGANAAAGGLRVGDVSAMDMEKNPPSSVNPGKWALSFLAEYKRLTGVKGWVYTFLAYAQEYFTNEPGLGEYPLWIADLTSTMPAPPKPWSVITAWQYSWVGRIAGIQSEVDMDTFNGDQATWLKLAKLGTIRTVTQKSGVKRSAYHGGADLLKLKEGQKVEDMGVTSGGFTQIAYLNTFAWIDSTHLS